MSRRPLCRATVCLLGTLLLCMLSPWNTPVLAVGDRDVTQNAADLVQEALHREVYGLMDQRNALLDRAAELAPDYRAGEVAPRLRHVSRPMDSGRGRSSVEFSRPQVLGVCGDAGPAARHGCRPSLLNR